MTETKICSYTSLYLAIAENEDFSAKLGKAWYNECKDHLYCYCCRLLSHMDSVNVLSTKLVKKQEGIFLCTDWYIDELAKIICKDMVKEVMLTYLDFEFVDKVCDEHGFFGLEDRVINFYSECTSIEVNAINSFIRFLVLVNYFVLHEGFFTHDAVTHAMDKMKRTYREGLFELFGDDMWREFIYVFVEKNTFFEDKKCILEIDFDNLKELWTDIAKI